MAAAVSASENGASSRNSAESQPAALAAGDD
jgi:hypothetical protein